MSLLSLPSLDELRSAVGNQVIIVTGAAQGIGCAIAQTLMIAGAQVTLADLDTVRGEQALSEMGHGALFVTCDVTSWTDHCRFFQTAMAHFGRIDTVLCNAGINPELTLGVRADFFADQDDWSVDPPDNNESNSNEPLYCASKHAALGLVRAVAQRPKCAASGIAISMVSLWFTQTPMTGGVSGEAVQGFPVSRPQDIAAAVSVTLTQSSTFINGKCIWVRGKKSIEVEDGVSQCLASR